MWGNLCKSVSVLKILDDNRNEPVKRKNIMLQIWGNEDKYISRRLDVFISKLRHLLQNDSSIEIRNIRSESLILIC
ncbi:MAG: helix-turn-helix domain-containing protein [Dysgonamonadaceae bacterium]|nr:helix-turn-helix domain-containing protein [Dysgonamonadaceae bacterium]